MSKERELTHKEQLVIGMFDRLRPGYGAIARQNILNNEHSGWADIIKSMTEEEIKLQTLVRENNG